MRIAGNPVHIQVEFGAPAFRQVYFGYPDAFFSAVVHFQDPGGRAQLRKHRIKTQGIGGERQFVRRIRGKTLFAAKNKQQGQQ